MPAGERLTEAADIRAQEELRKKTENDRRQAMDISVASMRPQPHLGGNVANLRIVDRAFSAVRTDLQFRKTCPARECRFAVQAWF
jgi:hypothetical protein